MEKVNENDKLSEFDKEIKRIDSIIQILGKEDIIGRKETIEKVFPAEEDRIGLYFDTIKLLEFYEAELGDKNLSAERFVEIDEITEILLNILDATALSVNISNSSKQTHEDLVEGLANLNAPKNGEGVKIKLDLPGKNILEKNVPPSIKVKKDERLKGKRRVSGSKKVYVSAPPEMG